MLLISVTALSQTEYVPVTNPVYNFLERMDELHLISHYNSFELPKTRKLIGTYLNEVISQRDKLDRIDGKILNDLEIEFENEIFGTLKNAQSLFGKGNYNIFSQKQKYLYYYRKPGKLNLFINLLGSAEGISDVNKDTQQNISAKLGEFGGEIRGTLLDKVGFYLKGTNGIVTGNREAAKLRPDINFNYKFNEANSSSFFDETQGYLTADFDLINFKIGRDRMEVGYGPIKSILGNNSPMFDYLGMNIKYSFFTFSYFHGQLLGDHYYSPDSVTGGIEVVDPKYVGYHRIGFYISRNLNFGAGELIIYGNRPIDLSYLNPFSFYKSVEHANRDRDNSMLFFDYNNTAVKGLKLYGTFLIDDVTFSKLGSGWWGNLFMYNLGLNSSNLYNILPLDIRLEYFRISPYVFTHRKSNNNYTNFGFPLGPSIQPNSESLYGQINYRITYRLKLSASYTFTLHGANPLNPDGSIKRNVGGNILIGHRNFDSESTTFLDGDREYLRNFTFGLIYEPFNQIFAKFNMVVINNSLQNSVSKNRVEVFLNLTASL